MLLMILRHGKAEKEAPTRRDADRALAAKGIMQAEHIAAMLAKSRAPLARPVAVLASRAERAKATAAIVAGALGLPVTFEDALTLGNSVQQAVSLARKLTERDEPVLLVGHNPQLEELAAQLTGKDEELRTGEMVCVEVRLTGKVREARETLRLRLED